MSDFIVWYDSYEESKKELVGGKSASLGEMMMAELPVPPGFALTTDAYQLIWRNEKLVKEINDHLRGIDHEDVVANMETSRQIRALVEAQEVPDEVVSELSEAYRLLSEHCGVEDVPVAVRSSATAEDQPDASFAGQQDTFLWVTGIDSVIENTKKCWSSLFTDRAIAYRQQMGYMNISIAMSVAIQKMVDPRASGVAFTLNPINGDKSQVAVDAAWGIGEAVVSGEVTPDNFLVDKVIHEIVHREISDKHIEYCLTDSGSVEKVEVEDGRRTAPCLSDDELKAIAILARRAEKHYGCPQDIEWAIDKHLPEGENILLLQSRPETSWSQKKKQPVAASGITGMSSIVSTLLAPLQNQNSDDSNTPGGTN